jgi:glutamyl/glutaminyl-tRNA synthetase
VGFRFTPTPPTLAFALPPLQFTHPTLASLHPPRVYHVGLVVKIHHNHVISKRDNNINWEMVGLRFASIHTLHLLFG